MPAKHNLLGRGNNMELGTKKQYINLALLFPTLFVQMLLAECCGHKSPKSPLNFAITTVQSNAIIAVNTDSSLNHITLSIYKLRKPSITD